MTNSAKKGERIAWVEWVQVVSMLLVTLHHCVPHGYAGPQWLLKLLNAIHHPALVGFFLTGGMLARHWRRSGWRAYMKKRFIRLMTPYFCVNLAMLPPRYAAARLMGARVSLSLRWLLTSFLDPHGQGIMPHLWFLPALLIMSALLPVIDLVADRRCPARHLSIGALLVLSALPVTWPTFLCLNELRLYLAWYVIGYALKEVFNENPPLRGSAGLAAGALGLAAFIATLYFDGVPLAPFIQMAGGGAFQLAAASLSKPGNPLAAAFRGKTYVIYLLSLCVQNLVEVAGYTANLPWWITALGMLAAGLAVPCAIWAWNARHPWPKPLRLMVGL